MSNSGDDGGNGKILAPCHHLSGDVNGDGATNWLDVAEMYLS